MADGRFQQPQLAESDWTLGRVEAAHLLHIEQSVCNRLAQPSAHTHTHKHTRGGDPLQGHREQVMYHFQQTITIHLHLHLEAFRRYYYPKRFTISTFVRR